MKLTKAFYYLFTIILYINACGLKNDRVKSKEEQSSKDKIKLEAQSLKEKEREARVEQQLQEKRMNKFDTLMIIDEKRYLLSIKREAISGKRFNGELDHKVFVLLTLNTDTVFSKSFTKYDFSNEKEFLSKAILYFIRFKSYSANDNKVLLFSSVTVPETDWSSASNIKIDLAGNMTIEDIVEAE